VNARFAAILVVLLVVLGGGALVYQQQERARRPANAATLGKVLFQDLKTADITAIRITEPNATLTLQRKDERWTIAERGGYSADVSKVRELVLKVIGLKVGQSEPLGEKDRARLNLDASGTRIEFLNSENKTLGSFTVGRKYFKREVENPEKANADGRFVVLPSETGTAYLVGDPLLLATAKTAEWIERTSFQVEKIRSLEVRTPDGAGWRVERQKDDAGWKLAGAKPGEKLDISRANAATYSLSLLEIADVAAKDADPKALGLDKPTTLDAVTLEGAKYAIKVGKLSGDNYPVTFTASGLKPDAKDAERVKLLSPHVLYIPKSKLDDTLKQRAELLEKPEAKKK
jgi:hypothetical protein